MVDFSLSRRTAGNNQLSAGSNAGAGNDCLGANQLTVGGNNLSTSVSGVISDCGAGGTACVDIGASRGSLVKVGTGTLTLTGNNTYTGGTAVCAGPINFNSTSNFGSGLITLNGGGPQQQCWRPIYNYRYAI